MSLDDMLKAQKEGTMMDQGPKLDQTHSARIVRVVRFGRDGAPDPGTERCFFSGRLLRTFAAELEVRVGDGETRAKYASQKSCEPLFKEARTLFKQARANMRAKPQKTAATKEEATQAFRRRAAKLRALHLLINGLSGNAALSHKQRLDFAKIKAEVDLEGEPTLSEETKQWNSLRGRYYRHCRRIDALADFVVEHNRAFREKFGAKPLEMKDFLGPIEGELLTEHAYPLQFLAEWIDEING